MGKPTGFIEYKREGPAARPVAERIKDYEEVYPLLPEEALRTQGARCMDCGIPFCQGMGCPVENVIPEFNDLIYRDRWRDALDVLHSTNNFPEFTGRACPAPCEPACVVAIHDEPVSIKQIELQIIEKGFEQGWVEPQPPKQETGRRVAVVGSGPAGLACAQQLRRVGHTVVLYEKQDRLGGLLRYGIPDFKLDKGVIERRLRQLKAEGIDFRTNVHVGPDVSVRYLVRQYDAVCLAAGAMQPRDLPVAGRDLDGVHFAMDFLEQQNRRAAGEAIAPEQEILATGKRVLVIGGGDTGADCVGTCNRQGAAEIIQLEILARPPESKNEATPWPTWPNILRTSSSHDEGCTRYWSRMTTSLEGQDGRVAKLHGVEVELDPDKEKFMGKKGTEFTMDADLVLLAMGFVHPVQEGMLDELGLVLDRRGNVMVDKNYLSSEEKVFSAGDMVRGASLVVHAIFQGRQAARGIDNFLMGETNLW
ncbi:MAG: glutamate synthase subunit beta [Candidatus Glassbacteria bacterium]|nr:glutamate synthase subunit beta [Candidatus Glassbacteria bacterium]